MAKYQFSDVFMLNAIASTYKVNIYIIDGVQDLALRQFETYVIKPDNNHFSVKRIYMTLLADHEQ